MSKPAVFEVTKYFVLLALAEGSEHGYAISESVVGDSVGGVYLRPSTLYSTLQRLERDGFIERTGHENDRQRKTYALTATGKRKLADQARMHDHAAGLAKQRLGLRY